MGTLSGKVAIVTGAAQGIGEATALLLAERGAFVAVVDKNLPGALDTIANIEAKSGKGIAIEADLMVVEDIRSCVEQTVAAFGRLDILVNNASDIAEVIQNDQDVVNTDMEVWDKSFAINLRAPAAGCKYAIPHMVEGGGGAIVNISSVQGLLGDVTRTAYSANKAGLLMLSKSVATQYGAQGVRCNTVCPGLVLSPSAEGHEDFLKIVEGNILTPYRGIPEHLAGVIAFLVSDEAAYVTAQTIAADGGLTNHMPYYAQVTA